MAYFGNLTEKYDKFVIFDTETTGLDFRRDEIIEFSAVVLETQNGEAVIRQEYDTLVSLTPGNRVPPNSLPASPRRTFSPGAFPRSRSAGILGKCSQAIPCCWPITPILT